MITSVEQAALDRLLTAVRAARHYRYVHNDDPKKVEALDELNAALEEYDDLLVVKADAD